MFDSDSVMPVNYGGKGFVKLTPEIPARWKKNQSSAIGTFVRAAIGCTAGHF
jgi:hypothetical protein